MSDKPLYFLPPVIIISCKTCGDILTGRPFVFGYYSCETCDAWTNNIAINNAGIVRMCES